MAVHAAESARGHDVDTDAVCDGDGARHGGSAVGAGREGHREVPRGEFGGVTIGIGEGFELITAQTNDDATINDTDGGGRCTTFAYGRLALPRDLEVDGRRQTVHDNGRLECHDTATFVDRALDLFTDDDVGDSKVTHAAQSVL